MFNINPKIKMWLGLALVVVVAGGQYLLKVDPVIQTAVNPVVMIALWLEGLFTQTPGDAKKITDLTSKLGGLSMFLLAGALIVTQPACKGVNFPSLQKVEQVVLDDLMKCGDSSACVGQMETDVATLIAQGVLGPTVGADAVMLVKDALEILIDAGVIPADVMPKAKACLRAEKLTLSTRQGE